MEEILHAAAAAAPLQRAMSAGQSRHSVGSSMRRRQEAELAAAEERELAAAEAAAAAARVSRLAAAELAAARAEVEAAEAAAAARVATAEAEALRSSVNGSVCADDSADVDLELLARNAARDRTARWVAEHAHGGGAPGGGAHDGGAPGGGAHGGGAPGGGAHGGWVDGEFGPYGVRAVVRDIGPGAGWPTLTKTNYVEWAALMKIRLQVRHMWEAVWYSDVSFDEDRRALDALIAAVPLEMQFSLTQKRTAKEAWDAIAAARIGSARARKTTLQALCKEWENLAFKPGEDIDDFALRLNTVAEAGAVRRRHLQRRASYREALPLRPREVQADRPLGQVSVGPLHDVDRGGDRSPQGRRLR